MAPVRKTSGSSRIAIRVVLSDASYMDKRDARQAQLDLERLAVLRAERVGLADDIASIGDLPEGVRRDVLNVFSDHAARLDEDIAGLEGELGTEEARAD